MTLTFDSSRRSAKVRSLKDVGEWGMLKRLLPRLPGLDKKRCLVGPGDDAAVFRARPGTAAWVFTTDMLVEGVHFDLRWTTPEDLGFKALAVNLSDLAAMGRVRPSVGVVSAGLPPSLPADFAERFYRGMAPLARRHEFVPVGGDTVRSDRVVVSVAVLGELPRGARPLTRSGARPGDVLMVTGTLGDAAAGLDILRKRGKGRVPLLTSDENFLVRRLLRPEPRIDLAGKIAGLSGVTAMMDCSDGARRSAQLIADASGVGVTLEADLLPVSSELFRWAGSGKDRARELALVGGEDYELVLAARPPAARLLSGRGWARPIGRVVRGRGVNVMNLDPVKRRRFHEHEHFQ